ncbi:DUF1758 domain-containing protein [Trichonephila clavata]|uniref:DUF1758 domain-containing protein n=1 Tax=Trichonephila clavata TaxID=2740835 RepID=A0A8X6HJ52_TRICU|nr:DUF1758 domain-containing protein [Trichonephila clavata]
MTIIELNRKQATFRNKVLKVKNFINSFQPTDSTKDYIALKSKLDLKDSLDTLSDLQDEAEETKSSFLVLLSNYESKKETVNNTSKNNHVKLPDLPLPTFSGALKNEASLIQSDQDSFDSLMKALEVRYGSTRALVDIHIAEILSINKLNRENPSQIRSIVEKMSLIPVQLQKRSVFSSTARIFDPLGFISAVVTKAKLVMQELCRLKLDWNDSLPIHLETQWKRFVKS